jgi:hypothetical protein
MSAINYNKPFKAHSLLDVPPALTLKYLHFACIHYLLFPQQTVIIPLSRSKTLGARSSVVVKALCYKPKGRGSIPDEVIFKFT